MSVSSGAEPKWWGWGDPARRHELGDEARSMLRDRLGEGDPGDRPEPADVILPEPAELPQRLVALLGDQLVGTHDRRLRRAVGRGYPDLVRLRGGALESAPDAVAIPPDAETVAKLLTLCTELGVAVVPFGGGTSVVGGVEALAGAHRAVIALDTRALRDCRVDRRSLTARLGPGLRGPEAEAALGREGLTLGHFPQSFEYASIGGFAATRSAGQASAGYGRFDELVSGLEMATPIGSLRTLETPHSAAGPSLRELAVGSEGTLGVITEVTARVRPAPASRRYEAWVCEDYAGGCELVRSLAQERALPDVTRLSDEAETEVSLALSKTAGWKRAVLQRYLALRGRRGGCMLITGWEGSAADVERRHALSARLLRGGGAAGIGAAPGRAWARGRYDGPYLRDELMDLGYFVETLETAHTWTRLPELYAAVGGALAHALSTQGTPGIVLCHLSHAYPDGASLYFTFIARARRGSELEQWRAVKGAASEAIVASGGTITHHHAIGRDHAPYLEAEVGAVGVEALRAVKERLDPAGVMNPGKLLPP